MIVSIALLLGLSCMGQKGMVVIKGVIKGDLKGHNKIYMYTRTDKDSVVVKNGHYSFSFLFKKPDMKMLYPEYVRAMKMMYRPFGVLITQPGIYTITTDIEKGMYQSQVSGPASVGIYQRFKKDMDEAYTSINANLAKIYGDSWYQHISEPPVKKSQDSLTNVFLIPVIKQLVKQHPDSYVSAFVLSGVGRRLSSLDTQEELYEMLSDQMKETDAAKKFYHYIQGIKSSAIGNNVANFILPNPKDKPIDFRQFKGQYVMLDFWASWCVPCRKSFPLMRRMYKQYKDQGFEIYSISIDESKPDWLEAVQEENNPWAQALDTKDVASKGFAVTAVPTAYLINPEGKIIAKQVGFDPSGKEKGAIDKKLEELFGPLKGPKSAAKPHKVKAAKMIPIQ